MGSIPMNAGMLWAVVLAILWMMGCLFATFIIVAALGARESAGLRKGGLPRSAVSLIGLWTAILPIPALPGMLWLFSHMPAAYEWTWTIKATTRGPVGGPPTVDLVGYARGHKTSSGPKVSQVEFHTPDFAVAMSYDRDGNRLTNFNGMYFADFNAKAMKEELGRPSSPQNALSGLSSMVRPGVSVPSNILQTGQTPIGYAALAEDIHEMVDQWAKGNVSPPASPPDWSATLASAGQELNPPLWLWCTGLFILSPLWLLGAWLIRWMKTPPEDESD